MPYYDSLGRYINPFYLDVHPDVRAELEMRAAFVASDYRSINTKSIEWPYQKMPWAHIVSVDYPDIRLGFEKEKFDDRNSDDNGNLVLYGSQRNQPKIPLLTGVEISNVGQRGSLLKGKFSFTYFPELTINGFELERLQGAFFTPGREVQITFGWSVYAENPWVNKLEFKGLIYGFNWSFQPNLSISAEVEIVSATTIALGFSGDQTVLETEVSDIVKIDGWDTELKGLNLLTVIDKDLSVITASLLTEGMSTYIPKSDTTEKLLDYVGIALPTAEFEEVQNIVINNYDYDPDSNTFNDGITAGQGQADGDMLNEVKQAGQQIFDGIWNDLGGEMFSDPKSEWNTAKSWTEKWEIIKRYANKPWIREIIAFGQRTPQLQQATLIRVGTDMGAPVYEEVAEKVIDLGAVVYDGVNSQQLSKTLDFKIIAEFNDKEGLGDPDEDDQLHVIEEVQIVGTFREEDGFSYELENNTKKRLQVTRYDYILLKPKGEYDDTKRFDRLKIKFKPKKPNSTFETLYKIKVVSYQKEKDRLETGVYRNNPKDSYKYIAKPLSILYKTIKVKAVSLNQKTSGNGDEMKYSLGLLQDTINCTIDIEDMSNNKKISLNDEKEYTYEVGKYYRAVIKTARNLNDKIYDQYIGNPRFIGGTKNIDFVEYPIDYINDGKSIYGEDLQKPAKITFEFTPKADGRHTYRLDFDVKQFDIKGTGKDRQVTEKNQEPVTYSMILTFPVGKNSAVKPADNDIKKEEPGKSKTYDEAKKDFDQTVDKKEQSSIGPDTNNPSDTADPPAEEQPVTATDESTVTVKKQVKTFWYVRLGSLVEFANNLLQKFEDDPNSKNKKFARSLFRFQAFNNEAEYNKFVKSSNPIDVYFPDIEMGRYGSINPFNLEGIYGGSRYGLKDGNQLLRLFNRVKGSGDNAKKSLALENDVINIGNILVGVDTVRSTYDYFLEEGGKNIALKNITKFFDEILKIISTSSGEIYQFTTILFEEPERLIGSKDEFNRATDNMKARGGSELQMRDIFSYDATKKRSRAIISLEDTNLAAKVIKEVSEPFKFDATVIRPMLRNVQIVSKPSKEMAAAAYIAARGQQSKNESGDGGVGVQNLEIAMNLKGYQNEKEYRAELLKTRAELKKNEDALAKSGWHPTWSELYRGGLIKLKRLTIEPHDSATSLGTSWLNRAIYPIEFSLTLDGINGFKFGDVIKTSLIPKHYNVDWGIVFTVTKVVHKVTLGTWETTLHTVARLDATRSYLSNSITPYN